LFHTDPSGTFLQYAAKAIGSGSEGAQQQLEQEYHKSMTLEEAEVLALTVLRQVMEEKLESFNIEVGVITTRDRVFKLHQEQKIATIITKLKPREEEQ